MKPIVYKTGIYFLLNKGVVVYVGQTTRYPRRLYHHHNQALPHDCVRFIKCEADKLNHYEQRWIRRFKPLFNSAHKPKQVNNKKLISQQYKPWRMKFRKLTKKSTIGFGIYRDRTVQSMFDHNRKIDLASFYFNLSHITFMDDVLDELKISDEWRIIKPGTDHDKYILFINTVHAEENNKRAENLRSRARRAGRIHLSELSRSNNSKNYNRKFNQK
jgi:hypothetical protein